MINRLRSTVLSMWDPRPPQVPRMARDGTGWPLELQVAPVRSQSWPLGGPALAEKQNIWRCPWMGIMQNPTWGPREEWTKAKVHMSLETWWDFDMLNTDCLETWQDVSPWPSASNTASKCPGSLEEGGRGGQVSSQKSLCWTQTCPFPCWSKSNSWMCLPLVKW